LAKGDKSETIKDRASVDSTRIVSDNTSISTPFFFVGLNFRHPNQLSSQDLSNVKWEGGTSQARNNKNISEFG